MLRFDYTCNEYAVSKRKGRMLDFREGRLVKCATKARSAHPYSSASTCFLNAFAKVCTHATLDTSRRSQSCHPAAFCDCRVNVAVLAGNDPPCPPDCRGLAHAAALYNLAGMEHMLHALPFVTWALCARRAVVHPACQVGVHQHRRQLLLIPPEPLLTWASQCPTGSGPPRPPG